MLYTCALMGLLYTDCRPQLWYFEPLGKGGDGLYEMGSGLVEGKPFPKGSKYHYSIYIGPKVMI